MGSPDDHHGSTGRIRRRIVAIEAADIAVGVWLARAKDHAGMRALATASEVGGWKSLLVLSAGTLVCGLVARDERLTAAGRRMLVGGVIASIVKTSVKRAVHRTRPNVLMDTGHYRKGWLGPNVGPWQSFPSGHSALSVAVARAVGRTYPGLRGPVYAGAAGIVAVQVLRGAHFPSDVLAGALIGVAAETIGERIGNSQRNDRPEP